MTCLHTNRPRSYLNHLVVTNWWVEGRMEVKGRRIGRRKQLVDVSKETRGYWKLKKEARDRTVWRTRFGRSYGFFVRQTTERMNVALIT